MDRRSIVLLSWFVLTAALTGAGAWVVGEPPNMVVLSAALGGLGGLLAVVWLA